MVSGMHLDPKVMLLVLVLAVLLLRQDPKPASLELGPQRSGERVIVFVALTAIFTPSDIRGRNRRPLRYSDPVLLTAIASSKDQPVRNRSYPRNVLPSRRRDELQTSTANSHRQKERNVPPPASAHAFDGLRLQNKVRADRRSRIVRRWRRRRRPLQCRRRKVPNETVDVQLVHAYRNTRTDRLKL
jgi:hypothetical protein